MQKNNNKKLLFILLATALLSLISVTAASPIIPSQYTNTPTNQGTIGAVHPSTGIYFSAYGEMFTSDYTCYLTNASFSIGKSSNPTGTLIAKLYAYQNGVIGESAYPSGTVLATSATVNAAELSTTRTVWTFTFDGTYQLQSGTVYGIVLEAHSTGFTGTNHVDIGYMVTGLNSSMNMVSYVDSGWEASATNDLYFVINADTEQPAPTTTPTPTTANPTADPQITEFTNNMIDFIVPLCLLLLPAIVGAWALGKSGAAKWGFIAGLNVGAILSYLYLDAFGIWAIIIIVIVDVVMIFSSSRGE